MSDEQKPPYQGRKYLHAPDSKGVLHHLSTHSSIAHTAAAANQYFAKWRGTKLRILQLPGPRSFALLTDGDISQLDLDFPSLAPALVQGKIIFSGSILMMRAIARGTKPTIDMFEPEHPEA